MGNEEQQGDIQPKLGIIAGGGALPREVIKACIDNERDIFVIAYEGETDVLSIAKVPHIWLGVGSVGKAVKQLKKEGVKDVLLVGKINRPSFSKLRLDLGGASLLKKILSHNAKGDNVLFNTIIEHLEDKGFAVKGVDELFPQLLADTGVLGEVQPSKLIQSDITLATRIANVIGKEDIGQAVVVHDGVVLGVEAVEGTDKLIARCGEVRKDKEGGVLVKLKKPHQDTRVDLPTIGLQTIENVHKAGLKAIAVEAGAAIIVDKDAVITRADQLNIVVMGV